MTPQELKNSILQMAIQGKLVEQRDTDTSVDVMISSMQQKRETLIKEKKLKKEGKINKYSEVTIDIPDSWRFVKLRNLVEKRVDNRGKTPIHSKKKTSEANIELLEINSIIPGKGIDHTKVSKYVSIDVYNQQRGFIEKDDILIATVGSIGKFALMDDRLCAVAQNIIAIKCFCEVDQKYVFYLLQTPYVFASMGSIKMEAVQASIKVPDLMNLDVPLPPLEEQKRIVAKIESLLPLIDKYEKAWTKLEEFNKKFPDDMQKSILQMAIQGKLVEQRDEEDSAEELYKQIQEEKMQLIKEGKIKKQKALPEITEDEIPFDIPDSWKWCYLGEIFNHISGKALNAKNTKGSKHKYITTSNVYWNHFELDNLKEMYYTDDEIEKYSLKTNDLLVLEGGDVGRTAIWNRPESYCIQNHIHRLRPYVNVNMEFFYYVMMFLKKTGTITGKGIGIKGLSAGALHRIIVPLPSLEEQNRIVEKTKELLNFCKKLSV